MAKRRKMTPEEIAERAAQKERTRRFFEVMERRLRRDEELAAARGPDEPAPPRLAPMSADELATDAARKQRLQHAEELMAWRLKRDAELAAAREKQQPGA